MEGAYPNPAMVAIVTVDLMIGAALIARGEVGEGLAQG